MSDEKNKADFLEGFTLAPDWAKKSADEQSSKFSAYSGDDEEDSRRGRGGGKSRFDRGWQDNGDRFVKGSRDDRHSIGGRPPRQDRDGGRRGFSRSAPAPRPAEGFDRRTPRRDDPHEDQGGQRRPRHDDRRLPLPGLPFDVRFLPEQKALSLIARKVQAGHRAIPLRNLVQLFFENPESADVRLEFNPENKEKRFHQCKTCGWFATTEPEARAHLMSAHFGDYFDSEEQDIEPPSGNFTSVARCGFTGKLLAPPNHHSYNIKIQQMLRTECAGKSEDEYRARIELLNDPEMVEQWRKENSKQIVYFLKERPVAESKAKGKKKAGPPQKTEPPQSAAAQETVPEAEAAVPAAATENSPVPEADVEVSAAAAENISETTAAEAAHDAVTPDVVESTQGTGTDVAEEADSPDSLLPPEPAKRMAADEAEAYFMEKIAPGLLKTERQITVSHAVSKTLTDRVLLEAISRAWDREQAVQTASLFFAVRGGLRSRKLALFRASDSRREEFVMHKQPTMLDVEHAVSSLRRIIGYITENRGCTKTEMLAELIKEDTPQEEADEMLKQVAFVTERGYIIEYYNGVLALPEEHPYFSQPRTAKKPHGGEKAEDRNPQGGKTAKQKQKKPLAEADAPTPAPGAEPASQQDAPAPAVEATPVAPQEIPITAPEAAPASPQDVPVPTPETESTAAQPTEPENNGQ